jgi:hypothetical protein
LGDDRLKVTHWFIQSDRLFETDRAVSGVDGGINAQDENSAPLQRLAPPIGPDPIEAIV